MIRVIGAASVLGAAGVGAFLYIQPEQRVMIVETIEAAVQKTSTYLKEEYGPKDAKKQKEEEPELHTKLLEELELVQTTVLEQQKEMLQMQALVEKERKRADDLHATLIESERANEENEKMMMDVIERTKSKVQEAASAVQREGIVYGQLFQLFQDMEAAMEGKPTLESELEGILEVEGV